jgi:hypothetical protein
MPVLSEIQGLLRSTESHEAIGAKCPRFIRTRWFYMIDTLAFILEHMDEIADYLRLVSVGIVIRSRMFRSTDELLLNHRVENLREEPLRKAVKGADQ